MLVFPAHRVAVTVTRLIAPPRSTGASAVAPHSALRIQARILGTDLVSLQLALATNPVIFFSLQRPDARSQSFHFRAAFITMSRSLPLPVCAYFFFSPVPCVFQLSHCVPAHALFSTAVLLCSHSLPNSPYAERFTRALVASAFLAGSSRSAPFRIADGITSVNCADFLIYFSFLSLPPCAPPVSLASPSFRL